MLKNLHFHVGRVSIPNWKIPSLDTFVESLIQKQDKLIQMGVLVNDSNNLSLLYGDLEHDDVESLEVLEFLESIMYNNDDIPEKRLCYHLIGGF